jgi:hypothetical protein
VFDGTPAGFWLAILLRKVGPHVPPKTQLVREGSP